jgi:hypothetical protein
VLWKEEIMAKEKRPKDDLQTMARSRMAHMPAETAGGRLDEDATPERDGRSTDPRRDMPQRRDTPPSNGGQPAQPPGAEAADERLMRTDRPTPMSRADKQRNQPRR